MIGQMRHTLRKATAATHQNLHSHPIMTPLTSHNLTIDQYIVSIKSLYGLHYAADNLLKLFWPSRPRRSHSLRYDLIYFGVNTENVPTFSDMSLYSSHASALGGRYVIDGSHFGIRIMASNIKQILGFGPNAAGTKFLDEAASADIIRDWHILLASLKELNSPEEQVQALQGAEITFSEIKRWLDSRLP